MKKTDVYYPDNSQPYSLMMVFLLVNTLISLITLNHMKVSYAIGVYILLTIAMSLFSFLVAVKLRSYQTSGLIMCAMLLVVQALRCLFLPELTKYSGLMLGLMLGTVALLAFSCVLTIKHYKTRNQYIDQKLADYQE